MLAGTDGMLGLSYVPLIAPATSENRMQILCKIADSFIYAVSRMGVNGVKGALNKELPNLLERVHRYSGGMPAAVGFGTSIRDDFLKVANIAEGVVIGSQIITTLSKASTATGQGAKAVENTVLRSLPDEARSVCKIMILQTRLRMLNQPRPLLTQMGSPLASPLPCTLTR